MLLNMLQDIRITDDDIKYAEGILLKEGHVFDDERVAFIKNLETIDLQAVPGSGKTTALLAKLLILDRYLPFSDGSGVLVISHTNAAIDEIKGKIGKHCSNLFSYPNFVGTIQGFVDKFFASPYYSNKYGKKVLRIDDQIYYESHYIPSAARAWLTKQQGKETLGILSDIKLYGDDQLGSGFPMKAFPMSLTTATGGAILKLKKEIREKGFLCFDDAFILAFEALEKYPSIKTLIQSRFGYIFVDEVQDMDLQQYTILENLFFQVEGVNVYQRIGDMNQAIFSNPERKNMEWKNRDKVLHLRGSHRLTAENAKVVEPFAFIKSDILGRSVSSDDLLSNIKPHIIVFRDSIEGVIPAFAKLISSFEQEGLIEKSPFNKYQAIGWVAKKKPGKITIPDYFPTFMQITTKLKTDFHCLESYINAVSFEERKTSALKSGVLNSFLKILRIEGVQDEIGRPYTKATLLSYINDNHADEYEALRFKLSQWSFLFIQGKRESVLNALREYIPNFLLLFGKSIGNSKSFIEDVDPDGVPRALNTTSNTYKNDDVEIGVSTVHSAKGQTHTATLYLETSYYEGANGVGYESQRLEAQFKGVAFNSLDKVRHVESTKMMYVGLSRPTHFVCFATHADHFNQNLNNIDPELWEVVFLDR